MISCHTLTAWPETTLQIFFMSRRFIHLLTWRTLSLLSLEVNSSDFAFSFSRAFSTLFIPVSSEDSDVHSCSYKMAEVEDVQAHHASYFTKIHLVSFQIGQPLLWMTWTLLKLTQWGQPSCCALLDIHHYQYLLMSFRISKVHRKYTDFCVATYQGRMQAVFWLPGNPPQPERRAWSIVILGDHTHHMYTYMRSIVYV